MIIFAVRTIHRQIVVRATVVIANRR